MSQTMKQIYNDYAREFDAGRLRTLFEKPWLDRFLDLLPRNPSILDLGCGAGKPVSAYLISKGAKMTGIDFAPAMLAIARRRWPSASWIEADIRELSHLGDHYFDGILSWNGLFHLSPGEQRTALPAILKQLHPGGIFMTTTGTDMGDASGIVVGHTVYHGSLAPDEYTNILDVSGLDVIDHVLNDATCNHHSILLASKRKKIL